VISSGISTITQNFIQIGLGVSVLGMRDFGRFGKECLGYFFFWGGGFLRKATAETRTALTQNTSNDEVPRKEVPFGVAKPICKV